jgi:hypothetical protein
LEWIARRNPGSLGYEGELTASKETPLELIDRYPEMGALLALTKRTPERNGTLEAVRFVSSIF